MDRTGGIPLLFWLGVIDITSVTRCTIFLTSVPLSLASLLALINRHKSHNWPYLVPNRTSTVHLLYLQHCILFRDESIQVQCGLNNTLPCDEVRFRLPHALLGSRRLLFDLLLLFETMSVMRALKSLCVCSSVAVINAIDCCYIVRCCSRYRQWKSEYITSLFPHMIHGFQAIVRHVNHDELKFLHVDQQQCAQHLRCLV